MKTSGFSLAETRTERIRDKPIRGKAGVRRFVEEGKKSQRGQTETFRTVRVKDAQVGPGILEAWRKSREEVKEEHELG